MFSFFRLFTSCVSIPYFTAAMTPHLLWTYRKYTYTQKSLGTVARVKPLQPLLLAAFTLVVAAATVVPAILVQLSTCSSVNSWPVHSWFIGPHLLWESTSIQRSLWGNNVTTNPDYYWERTHCEIRDHLPNWLYRRLSVFLSSDQSCLAESISM